LAATISQLESEPIRNSPAEVIGLAIEAEYGDYLEANYTNFRSRIEDLDQLANFARQFTSTEEFLAQLALLSNVEAEAEPRSGGDDERLRLSTVHQAKGLEFDVVFVIMLCDGLFPSGRSAETAEGLEEERRLFYVAITRARNELYLSYPFIRTVGARGGDIFQRPSRFLEELPPELVEEWDQQSPAPF
jgi:DNA helicase II / ATP-dependent DNA helicase PcrA